MKQKLKEQVLYCLKEYPETRDSDVTLTIKIWQEFRPGAIKKIDGDKAVLLKDLYSLPREDNVKRVRAHIQNVENLYLPTSIEVVRARKMNEQKWLDYMRAEKGAAHSTGALFI